MNSTSKWLNRFSGLPLTLVGLTLFLAGVLPIVLGKLPATLALAPGYIILIVNLIFAMVVREKIRHNLYLLIFHLALLLILISIGISRVTYFKGWVQIAEGEVLTEPSGIISTGYFHKNSLDKNPIRLLKFQAFFHESGRRGKTQSWLNVKNTSVLVNNAETADIAGYQFTVSQNIGFAADFIWISDQGDVIQGNAHFPSQIAYPETQGTELMLSGMVQAIWVGLEIQSERKSFFYPYFIVPNSYYLQIESQGELLTLFPDTSIDLSGGRLYFKGLSPWMGYDLYYDPAIYFLLISSLIGVLALALFLLQRNNHSKWNLEEENE